MDFLSFLTGVLAFIVNFAKAFAGIAFVGCIFMLIRLLPSRIRAFVSAFATSLLFLALSRYFAQQFSIIVIKTSMLGYLISHLSMLTVLFCVYLAINCGAVLRHIHNGFRKVMPVRNGDIKQHFARSTTFSTNSYLQTSLVLLQ